MYVATLHTATTACCGTCQPIQDVDYSAELVLATLMESQSPQADADHQQQRQQQDQQQQQGQQQQQQQQAPSGGVTPAPGRRGVGAAGTTPNVPGDTPWNRTGGQRLGDLVVLSRVSLLCGVGRGGKWRVKGTGEAPYYWWLDSKFMLIRLPWVSHYDCTTSPGCLDQTSRSLHIALTVACAHRPFKPGQSPFHVLPCNHPGGRTHAPLVESAAAASSRSTPRTTTLHTAKYQPLTPLHHNMLAPD